MTARFTKLLLTTLAAARLIIGPVDAQTPRTMTLVDVLNVPRITNPQLSPDGRDVVYVQSQADWKANKRVTHLWRIAVDGGPPARLTTGAEGENTPRSSPDGRTIALAAKRNGDGFAQISL